MTFFSSFLPFSHFSFPFFTRGFFIIGFNFSLEVDDDSLGMNARASRLLVLCSFPSLVFSKLQYEKN